MSSSKTRQQLEAWLSGIQVPDGSRVLDIGGSQKPIVSRVKWNEGTQFVILDLPTPHEVAMEANINLDIEQDVPMDIMLEHNSSYDVAFCIEVSEYWLNPLKALQNIGMLMCKGGTLYISFHMVYPLHNPNELDSIRYTEAGVRRYVKASGFEIKSLEYRTADASSIMRFYRGEGMRPSQTYGHHEAVGFMVEAQLL